MIDRPNILFVITDQQRWDALGCVGGWATTPHLDALAERSVRFENCVTNTPVCVPARYCLISGQYPHNTGIWDNCHHTVPESTRTWAQNIRDAGYHTALFGKTHWHPHRGDVRDREHLIHTYGFDHVNEAVGPRASARCGCHMTDAWEAAGVWDAHKADYKERFSNKPHVVRESPLGAELHYDVWVADAACEYLSAYDGEQPWMAYVGFPGPHEPWDTPKPWSGTHDPAGMPEPRSFPKGEPDRPRGVLDIRLETQNRDIEPDDPPKLRADYADNCTLIDDQIGKLLSVIEARGETENTVIVFTSDHGEMNGDAGLIYKSNFLDGAIRVPMIVHVPGAATGVSDSWVELNDVGPTLAELAGNPLTYQQFGKSLCPTLANPTTPHRTDALSEYQGEVMLIDDKWKAAINEAGQVYLLFDRTNDPEETTNLASRADMADVEAMLRGRILERVMTSQLRGELADPLD